MPESAFLRAGMTLQLIPQKSCRFQVFFAARYSIKKKDKFPVVYIVNIVFILLICPDRAVIFNKNIHLLQDIVVILYITGISPKALKAFQDDAHVVTPFGRPAIK